MNDISMAQGKKPLAFIPPFHHFPPPWPKGGVRIVRANQQAVYW